MEDTQLTLRDVLGPLTDFFTKLLSKDGSQWLYAFKRFLRKEEPWLNDLLEKLGTIILPATGKFVAKDHFTTNNKAVKIGYIGDNFQQHFLAKVEEAQSRGELCYAKLKKASLDAPILLDELRDKAETTLASIWELLKMQPNGEPGKLLINGYANIFYVRDTKGGCWAVNVYWCGVGWDVDADLVGHPHGWLGGYRVFSRNS